jgi:hypothetical protein
MTSASEAAVEHQRFQSRAATIGKARFFRAIADGGA